MPKGVVHCAVPICLASLTVTATDADLPSQTITFSLTGGVDQNKFAITSEGVLKFLTAPDFENPTDANGDNVYLVQVTASDGAGSTTVQNLSVTVSNINEAPSLSSIPAQTIQEDSSTGGLAFTIGDPDRYPDNLILSVDSSNIALIPNSNIVISGTAMNRSMIVTPVPNQSGTATITLTVNDGQFSAVQTFEISVQPVDDPAQIALNSAPLIRTPAKKVAPIDPSATIFDVDTINLNFNGAVLEVSGQATKDTLSILKLNGIARKGKKVVSGTTVVGVLTGGKKGVPLTVILNGAATQSSVQSLLRNIGFKSTDKSPVTSVIKMRITNIGGVNSN